MPIKCIVKNGLAFWSNCWIILPNHFMLEVQRQHIRSALGLQGLIVVSRMMLSLIFCAKSLSTPNWAQSRLFSLSIDYMTSWWYSERHTILTEFGLYDWRGSLVDSKVRKPNKSNTVRQTWIHNKHLEVHNLTLFFFFYKVIQKTIS